MNLERLTGPECPDCGCHDSEVVARSNRFGRGGAERRGCRNCGRTWSTTLRRIEPVKASPEPGTGVTYPPPPEIHCPNCGSIETRVTTTQRPIRHHKCLACERCFKSFERTG